MKQGSGSEKNEFDQLNSGGNPGRDDQLGREGDLILERELQCVNNDDGSEESLGTDD